VQPAGAFSAAGHEFGGLWDPLKSRLRARLSQPDHHSLTPAEGRLLSFKDARVDVRMEHQNQLIRSGLGRAVVEDVAGRCSSGLSGLA
jgi:hypothetical protein